MGAGARRSVDRPHTNDGLSGMLADGISLSPKKGTLACPAGPARRLGAVDYCGRLLLVNSSLIAPMLTLFKPAHIERFNRSVETFQSQVARRLKLEIAFD
jgi:hypothetical protein